MTASVVCLVAVTTALRSAAVKVCVSVDGVCAVDISVGNTASVTMTAVNAMKTKSVTVSQRIRSPAGTFHSLFNTQ